MPLWAMDKVAVRPPAVEGLKAILAAQVAPGAKEAEQALLTTNSLGTEDVTPLMASEVLPVLVKLIVADAEVWPTTVVGRTSMPGSARKEAEEVEVPVPDKLTARGVPEAGVIVRTPVRAAAAVGAKLSVTVQVAPAESVVLVQVLAVMAKSDPEPVEAVTV